MVNGSKAVWQLVMCGITSGLLGGPSKFNIRMFAFNARLGEREVSTNKERWEGKP